jgi:hypothetical protein
MTATGSFVKDHVEAILHFDEELAISRSGDLEFNSAAEWSDSFDNWLYGIPADLEAKIALAAIAEGDLILETISEAEQENEMDPEEFERWLDSLEPSIEEVERRDAFIGERP